jgi:deoxyribonuclease-4
MGWVNGIRMGKVTARAIAEASVQFDVALTAHAPYYLNLCGASDVVRRSRERLVATGELAANCGARSVCFHAGFYQGQPPARAREAVRVALAEVTSRLADRGIDVDIRPELTGKPTQVGSFEEILEWSAEVKGVRPCVDFSHQYARHGGAYNSYDEFRAMLQEIQRRLGREALDRLHVHIAGIEFGPRGERRHLPLRESKFRYRELLRALKDVRVSGWVVCESPLMEQDALLLQRTFRRLT